MRRLMHAAFQTCHHFAPTKRRNSSRVRDSLRDRACETAALLTPGQHGWASISRFESLRQRSILSLRRICRCVWTHSVATCQSAIHAGFPAGTVIAGLSNVRKEDAPIKRTALVLLVTVFTFAAAACSTFPALVKAGWTRHQEDAAKLPWWSGWAAKPQAR